MRKLLLALSLLCCGVTNAAELDFSSFKYIGVGYTGGRLSIGHGKTSEDTGNQLIFLKDGGSKNFVLSALEINCDARTFRVPMISEYSGGALISSTGIKDREEWHIYGKRSTVGTVAKQVCKV